MHAFRLIRVAVVAVAACGCEVLDDDEPPADDAAKDRAECELAMVAASCPPSWAKSYHSVPREEPTLDLADIGEPVCNGLGVYVEPAFFEAVHVDTIVGVTLVNNSQCSVLCHPECRSGSVCWTEKDDGQQCGNAARRTRSPRTSAPRSWPSALVKTRQRVRVDRAPTTAEARP